jgi:hypothetical protein
MLTGDDQPVAWDGLSRSAPLDALLDGETNSPFDPPPRT